MERFHRNAALLWSGQFASQMGHSVFEGAVLWLALSLTGSGLAAGMGIFLFTVPFLVLGPFAGAWVDRVDRRAVLVGSDVVRGAVLLALPFLVAPGPAGFAWVAAGAFLVGCAATPFLPARDALLPVLAEGRPLVRVNAAFQTSGQVAQIAGLAVGGALLADGALPQVLFVVGLDGAAFLVSAVTLSLLALPKASSAPRRPRRSIARETADSFRDARRDPLLRDLLLLTALDNFVLMGPGIVGAALYVKEDLGLGARELAWFEGAMAIGFFAGALGIARFAARTRNGPLVLWGMLLDGLTYLPLAWIRSYPLALAAILVHGVFIPWIVVGRTSLLQAHVPPERRGRVFALVHLTVAGMTALSSLAAGALGDVIGARGLFVVAGALGALCGAVGLRAFRGGRLLEPEASGASAP
jgi:DHA3 family macrolide efflux protein-like MFS transporter